MHNNNDRLEKIEQMQQINIKKEAIRILAESGVQAHVQDVLPLLEDPNAVLKLSYCLEAIEEAIIFGQSISER